MSNTSNTNGAKKSNQVTEPTGRSAAEQHASPAGGVSAEDLARIHKQVAEAGRGLDDRRSDVVGYWKGEQAPIYCKPLHVKLFDSQINPRKPSELVVVIALLPTVVESADGEQKKVFMCNAGDVVGIWMKPGLRGIANCAGVPTTITFAGTKKVHKNSDMQPMKQYAVKATGGNRLAVEEDRRDQSMGAATIFDLRKLAHRAAAPTDIDYMGGDEDIPF